MLWVILVHAIYWGKFCEGPATDIIKSFTLFEMPLIFLVTGASNSFSTTDNYPKFIKSRLSKILIPYWIYALICFTITMATYKTNTRLHVFSVQEIFLSWLIPLNIQVTTTEYIRLALWYIPVYIAVIALVPPLKILRKSRANIWFGIFLLTIFLCGYFKEIEWLQTFTFYLFWTYVGMFYGTIKRATEKTKIRRLLCLNALMCILILLVLNVFTDASLDMHLNKFPPNLTFLVFSCMAMSLILLTLPYIPRIIQWIESQKFIKTVFDCFSYNSITIFLYQSLIFHLTVPLTNYLVQGRGWGISGAKTMLCFLLTILACTGFVHVIKKIAGSF